MMAAFFLACSIVFLLQFFVWYCRSLISASVNHQLSEEVRDVMGLSVPATGEDFARVSQLLLLCPERPEDRSSVRAVGAYFRLLNVIRRTLARMVPSAQVWIERERAQCTYFAAVTLDRRIAFSRDLLAQQIEA
jgi:hypothetical protein